jgi:hypothetical protein
MKYISLQQFHWAISEKDCPDSYIKDSLSSTRTGAWMACYLDSGMEDVMDFKTFKNNCQKAGWKAIKLQFIIVWKEQ